MINAEIFHNEAGSIIGFTVNSHGEETVCAAVSMLVINTINSIERLTDDDFSCEFNEDASDEGFIKFMLSDTGCQSEGARILLNSLAIGLESARELDPSEMVVANATAPQRSEEA
jgi:uncharacterized protein YsxB (DUF464 family)